MGKLFNRFEDSEGEPVEREEGPKMFGKEDGVQEQNPI